MIIKCRADLAREIKAAAARRGVPLATVAARLGVVAPSISRTVNRSDITLSTLQKIADALDYDLVIEITPREIIKDI